MNSTTSCVAVCLAFACAIVGPAAGQTTTRVSVGPGGLEGNSDSNLPAISAGGRFVAFCTKSWDFVPGDTDQVGDVFVRDRAARTTTCVSVDAAGVQGNASSLYPSISADGRFVAFQSKATNLVPGDTNLVDDVFVHDRLTGITSRVSVDSSGAQANGVSNLPSISADGRFVLFTSDATNLVASDTNALSDVFVHDRVSGFTTRVSVTSAGTEGAGPSGGGSICADGSRVTFTSMSSLVTGDTNGVSDIYVRDISSGAVTCASVELNGLPGPYPSGSPVISGDGRFVAFVSDSTNLSPVGTSWVPRIFVRDLAAATTTLVSADSNGVESNTLSDSCSISFHGRFVAFASEATNLVPNDANGFTRDIFLRDVGAGTTTLVSRNSLSVQSSAESFRPAISLDGRHVAFFSKAANLAHGDTNGRPDVFVHDLP